MFQAIVGQSEDPLTAEAVREVIGQIRSELPEGMKPQAGIVFCSIDLDHAEILSRLHAEYPAMEVIGCTTDGEIASKKGFTDDSLVLMVFVSDTVEIRAGVGKNAASDGEGAGREAAYVAHSRLQRQSGQEKFAIILTDPFNAGVSAVDKGIQGVLGEAFPVFGGAAPLIPNRGRPFSFVRAKYSRTVWRCCCSPDPLRILSASKAATRRSAPKSRSRKSPTMSSTGLANNGRLIISADMSASMICL